MREIAKNRPKSSKFHRKKKRNFFVIDPIGLKFKLDLNIVESKFPIDFQGPSTEKSKVTFFLRNLSIFVTLCIAIFVLRKIW